MIVDTYSIVKVQKKQNKKKNNKKKNLSGKQTKSNRAVYLFDTRRLVISEKEPINSYFSTDMLDICGFCLEEGFHEISNCALMLM